MTATLAAALLAGLLGSPHCAGMCGAFAAVCARARAGVPLWHAGRLTTYAVLGAVAGAFGAVIPGPAWVPAAVSVTLLLWFCLSLAGLAPAPTPRAGWIGAVGSAAARRAGPASRYLFGLVNGLIPCGLVYAALAVPITLADPLAGAAAMLAFGVGTIPALSVLPGLFRGLAGKGIGYRRALAALVLAAGLWSVGLRAGGAAHAGQHGPSAEVRR